MFCASAEDIRIREQLARLRLRSRNASPQRAAKLRFEWRVLEGEDMRNAKAPCAGLPSFRLAFLFGFCAFARFSVGFLVGCLAVCFCPGFCARALCRKSCISRLVGLGLAPVLLVSSPADLASSYFVPPKWCVPVCRIKHTATPPLSVHAYPPTHTHTHVRTQIQLETWFVGSTCLLTFNFISLLLRWFLSVTIQTGKSRSIRIFYYSQIFYNVMKRQFKRLFSKKKDFQIEIEGSSFLNDGLHCSYSFEHFAYSSLICSFAHCFYQCRPQPVQLAVCKVFGQLGLFVVALAPLCFPGGRRRILKGCRKRLNLILLGFLCILEPTSECWHSVFA